MQFTELSYDCIALIRRKLKDADAILIGAGAGLSTAAAKVAPKVNLLTFFRSNQTT